MPLCVAPQCTLSWRLRGDGAAFTPAATATATATATAATATASDGYTSGGGSWSPTASTDTGVADHGVTVVTNMGTVAATAPVAVKNAVATTAVVEAPNAAAAVVESPAAAAAAAAQAKQQMGTQGELMQVRTHPPAPSGYTCVFGATTCGYLVRTFGTGCPSFVPAFALVPMLLQPCFNVRKPKLSQKLLCRTAVNCCKTSLSSAPERNLGLRVRPVCLRMAAHPMQVALLAVNKVVRSFDGVLLTP